jgi:CheY-like chemotaxis protein
MHESERRRYRLDDRRRGAPSSQTAGNANATPAPPPAVLIVDDDVDVHVVTKFSLSNACFLGRRLSFLHAYSGEEALNVLRNTPDIALVLLDVIMETSDAGLLVARQIRDRTAQPWCASCCAPASRARRWTQHHPRLRHQRFLVQDRPDHAQAVHHRDFLAARLRRAGGSAPRHAGPASLDQARKLLARSTSTR